MGATIELGQYPSEDELPESSCQLPQIISIILLCIAKCRKVEVKNVYKKIKVG